MRVPSKCGKAGKGKATGRGRGSQRNHSQWRWRGPSGHPLNVARQGKANEDLPLGNTTAAQAPLHPEKERHEPISLTKNIQGASLSYAVQADETLRNRHRARAYLEGMGWRPAPWLGTHPLPRRSNRMTKPRRSVLHSEGQQGRRRKLPYFRRKISEFLTLRVRSATLLCTGSLYAGGNRLTRSPACVI